MRGGWRGLHIFPFHIYVTHPSVAAWSMPADEPCWAERSTSAAGGHRFTQSTIDQLHRPELGSGCGCLLETCIADFDQGIVPVRGSVDPLGDSCIVLGGSCIAQPVWAKESDSSSMSA